MVLAVTMFLIYQVLLVIAPESLAILKVRFKITSPSSLYNMYLAPRLGNLSDLSTSKLVRSGAVDIFQNNPLFGLGFTVVGKTTDSFLLGILIMGGVIGGLIYASFIFYIFWRLYQVTRCHQDRTVVALARVMLFLGVIFLAGTIGFHTFIQDRAGDAYWFIVGLIISPALYHSTKKNAEYSGLVCPKPNWIFDAKK